MSEFDKEAERERLREKYERDRQQREAAQQMSDLLLKGATMTDTHCGECGAPIFRQNDQEFCPNCGAEAAEGDGQAAGGQAAGGEQQAPAQQPPDAEVAEQRAPDQGADDQSAEAQADAETGAANAGANAAPPQNTGQSQNAAQPAATPQAGATSQAGNQPQAARQSQGNDAVAALQQALLRHAQAANTDDPRAARDHLEAAREAAEALAALQRQG